MPRQASYLLCGTPRTGSTLLCSLLGSTGVLGRPESYFREPDEASWAHRFGLPHDGSHVRDYDVFVRAVRTMATSHNGVFGARVMWGSLERVTTGLARPSGRSDLVVLEEAFGPLRFVHLMREDIIGQAVSWYRAEQTGFWQQGDDQERSPKSDLDGMKVIVGTIREHNAAWRSWFDDHGVSPDVVTYEQLVQDRRATVEGIAAHVGVTLPADWLPVSPHRKQADDLNAEWASALRRNVNKEVEMPAPGCGHPRPVRRCTGE
jgi:trehalose 2-sulfotransferase